MRIELGKSNRLRVVKRVDFGMYLDGDEDGEILLPSRYVPAGCKPGDELDVLIYLDNEERLVATTERPLVYVGEFAFLRVSWVNAYGAFLYWGPMKDLFVPFREQPTPMRQGESYVVHVHVDAESFRIAASARVEHYLSHAMPPYREGDPVEVLVYRRTPLGYLSIVDNLYSGLIYANEVFGSLDVGTRTRAYVRRVRTDSKLDLSIQRTGRGGVDDFAQVLLDYLHAHGGRVVLGDKSPAEDIYAAFGVSKKTFKRAAGELYRQRLISITDTEIRVTDLP